MDNQKKLLIGLVLVFSFLLTMICLHMIQIVTYITTDPIKVEVINYVLEHKDTPEFEQYKTGGYIYYTSTGYWDASVTYGFRYRMTDTSRDEPNYGDGYRVDFGNSCDWYYTEYICEQWWYYELHEG